MSVSTFIKAKPVVVASILGASAFAACTLDYPLEERTLADTTPLVVQRPIDFLFVVDNSASMQEEQAALYRSVFDERCPITDVRRVPTELQNPDRPTFDELADVCGIAQLMAAMGSDYHIGVVATDVGNYDERLSSAQDLDNSHEQLPMRACLQGKGLITRNDDIAVDFRDAVIGLGTWGSSIERGLDAMEVFLDPDSRRAPGCENDLDGFLRGNGQLMVVFVTDEDDCSHRDGSTGFPDELADEPREPGEWFELSRSDPGACYARSNELASVASYRDVLTKLIADRRTTDVFVSVVAGLRDDGAGLNAGACIGRDDGSIDGACLAALGTSNSCAPGQECCTADSGSRYVELARAINADSLLGSICSDDFRQPLMPLFSIGRLGGDDVF